MKFLTFLNVCQPKTQLIKIHNSLDSSRSHGRMLEIKKTGGSRELLLPGNDFQTSSTANYPKKHADLGSLETNQRHETQA